MRVVIYLMLLLAILNVAHAWWSDQRALECLLLLTRQWY